MLMRVKVAGLIYLHILSVAVIVSIDGDSYTDTNDDYHKQ